MFCNSAKKKQNSHTLCPLYVPVKPEDMIHRRPIFALLTVSSILENNQRATTLRLPRDNVKNGLQCYNNMHVRACQHSGCGYLSTQADCTTHFTHCTISPVWFTLYRHVCTTRSARFTLYEQTTLWRITLSNSTTPVLSTEKNGHNTEYRAGTLCPKAQICRNYPSGACT